jgi:superfamily II DNA or RNA helicase
MSAAMPRSLAAIAVDPTPHLDQRLAEAIFGLLLERGLRDRLIYHGAALGLTLRRLAANPVGLTPLDQASLARSLEAWLARQPRAQPRAQPLATTADLEPARQLVAASDLPDLPDWDVGVFDEALESDFMRPLGDVLKGHVKLSAAEARALNSGLESFLGILREERSRSEPPALIPTGVPRADAFLNALLPEALALAQLYPLGFLAPEVDFQREGEDFIAVVTSSLGAGARVQWPSPSTRPEAPVTCSCGRPVCLHRAAALCELVAHEGLTPEFFSAVFSQPWERLLRALEAPVKPQQKHALVVIVGAHHLAFALSRLTSRGGVSKTWRKVTRLGHLLTQLSGRDLELARCVALAEVNGGDLGELPRLLAGFPRVCWAGETAFLPCRLGTPRVEFLEREGGVGLSVRLDDEVLTEKALYGLRCAGGLLLTRRHAAEVVLYQVPAQVTALVHGLARHGSEFPDEALPALHEAAGRLELVARVDLPETLRGEEVQPTGQHRLQLVRDGGGLGVQLRVEPLKDGPLFTPGHGVPVAATFDGARRTWARRDLEAELHTANAVTAELGLEPEHQGEFTWQLMPGPGAIEFLRRVHTRADPMLTLEWTGIAPRFTAEARASHLGVRITRSTDWFDLAGTLEIDGRRVALAQLLEAARARRRWVQVGDDDFVQLSQELVEAVAPLAHLGESRKAPTLTLGALPTLEALGAAGADVTAAEEWVKLMERLKAARTREVHPPELPVTPRDYQRVGFEWMTRLADWSTGAVLADDMGLGKTLQALMLLVSRAKAGPALIIAPSSVLHTWRTEAARHAPSLKFKDWSDAQALKKLGKGQVLLATWTLFARDAAALTEHHFSTVVLDEAHAIKNGATQRAKAAHQLKADFVLALSGTPIENHVGELWSLFRAVMPSLLGNEESFRRRFGAGDEAALHALARLIRPFILRRTKAQVATELPPRTELDVVVPLTDAERALYEDVRLNALAEVGERQAKRFDVLAALTRLRLTACHPMLVDPKWRGPTSKLDRLEELLADLTQAGHRALVFSQFTSHLGLVQTALRKRGVAYSYLDGQTPVAQRGAIVEQFQAGRGGAVFLISLRAGGTGLTLTAADYVIHLDPWWNPAVEDQASDRAHRIGQTKPVTVYRLIAEGTIEQKILALHGQKRELVDSLLAGTDAAGAMKTEDLLDLLRET